MYYLKNISNENLKKKKLSKFTSFLFSSLVPNYAISFVSYGEFKDKPKIKDEIGTWGGA
jgi:hypothetical protein